MLFGAMALWAALGGCDHGASDGGGASGDGVFVDPDLPPELTIDAPAAAAFLDPGRSEVTGAAVHVTGVTVNGAPASTTGAAFVGGVDLPTGMTTIVATGAAPDGAILTDGRSVLAGPFAEPSGKVGDAVRITIGAPAFAAFGPMVANGLDPVALSAQITALNPVLDTPEALVNLSGLTFDPAQVDIVPGNGLLDVSIVIPGFSLGIDATIYGALPFGLDLTLNPDVKSDEVRIHTTVTLASDGQGGLAATVGPLEVELVGFDLDTGILELVDWLVIDEDDLATTIEDQLAGLGAALQPQIDAALAGLDLTSTSEVLGATMTVAPAFDTVTIDPTTGLSLGLGIAIDVDAPAPNVPGHVTFAPPPPVLTDGVAVQLADDFMNRALFEVWSAGGLDMNLPLGPDDAAILFLFGGKDSGNISLTSALPPVWLGRDGEGRLQLGEIALTVDTPGGTYGDKIELIVAIDAKAEITVGPDVAGVTLSDADVFMRATGASAENPELVAFLPNLASAFGLGIGVINEQLSFPLTDASGAPMALPPLLFARDPSGLGTLLELSVDDLASFGSTTTGTGGTTTGGTTGGTSSSGMSVAIPAGTVVTTNDDEIDASSASAWICSGDDIDATGHFGTWYVDDNGGIVVYGTGHTVYAADNADVVLEGAGNLVYADPGANVDDNDGWNAVIIVDPLTFDLTNAPVPGC